jgi:hypothetical protein
MHVIDAARKGGPHDHVSVCRYIVDFGIPNFHGFRWCYRPKASSLNRVLDVSIPSGDTVVELPRQRVQTALSDAVKSRLACV